MRFLTPFFYLLPLVSFSQFKPENIINISADGGAMVRTFDCDSDGDQDVIAAMTEGVFLFKNDGTGAMSTPEMIRKGWAVALDAADFDGDGISDIVSATDNGLFFQHGLGNGHFSVVDTAFLASYLQDFNTLVAADMDGDGDKDLLTSSNGVDAIYWYENNGAGVFLNEHMIIDGWNPTAVFAADFDNDGDNDVVYSLDDYSDVYWIENLGNGNFNNGTFNPQHLLSSGMQNVESVFAADLDNDGDKDILAASRGDHKIVWFRNDSGVFTNSFIISTTADYSYAVAATDVDADGDLDVVYGGEFETGWHENLGSGNFGPENLISTTAGGIRFLALVDLDNNGTNDFVSISTDNGPKILFFPNNGGAFGTAENILAPAAGVRSFTSFDVDNDGDLDLLTASYTDDKIAFHENLGNGEYSPQKLISTLANGVETVVAADLDGDQLTDVVSASSLDNKIAWYKNTGGQFAAQQVIASSMTGIQRIDAADVDNDGDIDVVAAFENQDRYIWFENLGLGTFSAMKFISGFNAINNPRFISVGDLDGDNIKDVLGFSDGDSRIMWYKKNGASWTSHNVGIKGNVTSVRAADLDNDNDNDVVITTGTGFSNDGGISWYENLGGGTFSSEKNILLEYPGILDIGLADLDLDGDTDIVSTRSTYYKEGICWFENDGSGFFEKRISGSPLYLNNNYSKVLTADVDNDGDQDVFTISSPGDKIALNKNEILAPFQARGNFYIDANQNGQRDSLEVGFALPRMQSSPNHVYSYTYDNGRYSIDFDPAITANYVISPSDYDHWGITSDSLSYHAAVTPAFIYKDSLDFGFYPTDQFDSLTPNVSGEFPRCNSTITYWLSVKNNGTTQPSGIMEFVLDTNITFISSNITPDSIVSNHYYWSYDSLNWFASTGVKLQVQLPDFNAMGDTLSSYLTAISDVSGNSFSNQFDQIVVCAYDPNDKAAEPMGFGPEGFILPDVEYIDYTIRFQNTGNDTSITVVIRDQLDTNFVWSSLRTLASSHEVETTISSTGELVFNFEHIYLPDSIVNEPASHGFVKYRIWLKSGLEIGTTFKNTANIYFDYNPAVVTNTTTHTLFECSEVNLLPITTAICEGSDLQGAVSNILYDDISWKINGVFDIGSDELLWNADTSGNFNLQVSRSNPYCYEDTIVSVIISPVYEQFIDSLQICSGEAINIFGSLESTTGNYYNTLSSAQGCDSVLVIHLRVNPNPFVEISTFLNDTICLESGTSMTLPGATPIGGVYTGTGVSGSSFDPVVAGIGIHAVSYTYEDSLGCSNSDFTTITVETCLTIHENQSNEWNVYPNPAMNQLFIESVEAITISIIDMTGKTILSQVLSPGKNELDVSPLTNGVYVIQSESGVTVKFVKQ